LHEKQVADVFGKRGAKERGGKKRFPYKTLNPTKTARETIVGKETGKRRHCKRNFFNQKKGGRLSTLGKKKRTEFGVNGNTREDPGPVRHTIGPGEKSGGLGTSKGRGL